MAECKCFIAGEPNELLIIKYFLKHLCARLVILEDPGFLVGEGHQLLKRLRFEKLTYDIRPKHP